MVTSVKINSVQCSFAYLLFLFFGFFVCLLLCFYGQLILVSERHQYKKYRHMFSIYFVNFRWGHWRLPSSVSLPLPPRFTGTVCPRSLVHFHIVCNYLNFLDKQVGFSTFFLLIKWVWGKKKFIPIKKNKFTFFVQNLR